MQKESGTLDVLLHNSGILQVLGATGSAGVFDVNVRGAKACIEAISEILTKDRGMIIVVSSEVGTWTTDAMEPALRAKVLDGSKTEWPQVENWMDDWLRHEQGAKDVKELWMPVDELLNAGYSISKAFLNAYLRNYSLQSRNPPVAVVCPGYYATNLYGARDLNGSSGRRPASQGGESVI